MASGESKSGPQLSIFKAKGEWFMAINTKCSACKRELGDFGAILLGPPDEDNKVEKFHLCGSCFDKIVASQRLSN